MSFDKRCIKNSAGSLTLLLLLICSALAHADGRIGLVKTLEPTARVLRQGAETDLQIGAEIFQGDTLITGSGGAVGITFSDGAVLTLGPNGQLVLEDYQFQPVERKLSFISRIIKGSVAFISGAIGRIAPESVQFKTPTASLGLRGTKILIEVE